MADLPVTVSNNRATPGADGAGAAFSQRLLFRDCFSRDLPRGRVIGSSTGEGGVLRKGADREGVIGIDNGALRIESLVRPGWGRAGIAYGPFRRENGLAFHVCLLNGHNISRSEPLPDGFKMRLWRWALGSETEPAPRRILRWFKSGQKRHMWRRLRQWVLSGAGLFYWPLIKENLAAGWFPGETPATPSREGCSLVMHSVVAEGGELRARVGEGCPPTLQGVQNVPMHYAVVLRERGAAYYAASALPGIPGVPQFPQMRPLAIDAFNADETLHAGVHQSVLGEIGFRVDTRVYGAQVIRLPEWNAWYGSAQAADSLTGRGPLAEAETGERWQTAEGEFERTERGVVGLAACNRALLWPASPSGLIHLLIDCQETPVEGVAVIWRAEDEKNFWCFEVGSARAQLSVMEDGKWIRHPALGGRQLPPNTVSSLQVFDDGERIRICVNGQLAYGATFHDTRLQKGAGAGIQIASPGGVALRSFEAHPREVAIPGAEGFEVPHLAPGDVVVAADTFDGPGGDLDGHITTLGGRKWSRAIGRGVIELTGRRSARVRATAAEPCPGRTAYLIDWPDPGFADIETTITPAGKRRGTREKGRAGLIFWQDAGHYLILSAFVENWPAMSIAAFFQMQGFEELFDAVWTNVGSRMHWGEPHAFRVLFDGAKFTACINGEPVLYRALRDVYPCCAALEIRRVGIVANWEWGNDTGSTFENFVGRKRG